VSDEIHLDTSAFVASLARAREEVAVAARQTLGQGVALALKAAKATTKFKDGPDEGRTGPHLRDTIERGQRGPWVLFIKAGAKHAKFVEGGTKAHRIEARHGRVLRFVQAGQIRFRRHVWHPGTKATHFMDDAATVGARFLDWRMEENVARVLR